MIIKEYILFKYRVVFLYEVSFEFYVKKVKSYFEGNLHRLKICCIFCFLFTEIYNQEV